MAELADALDLGSSPHRGLGVRLPSLAPELKRSLEVTETTSVRIEELNQVKRKLSFEIPWEEVKRELDSAYQKVGKKARIKGFRPGKLLASSWRHILKMKLRARQLPVL